jgi:hypothetical protein
MDPEFGRLNSRKDFLGSNLSEVFYFSNIDVIISVKVLPRSPRPFRVNPLPSGEREDKVECNKFYYVCISQI